MKFQILIPTYNRQKDLQQNLLYLKDQLIKYNLAGYFGIAISDNASTDGTAAMLEKINKEWPQEIKLDILRNENNVGLEQNTVNLLRHARSEYIIWLGDDDILAEGYLPFVKEQFCSNQLGWMIPGLMEVDKEGKRSDGRPADFEYRQFKRGYETMLQLSHLGHQMSGLVVKRQNLADVYLSKQEWRNPYLFIFFLSYNQLFFEGVYAPAFKTAINNYNPKDWGYNDIGLLDEVFRSYYYFKEELGQKKLNDLLRRFVLMHSYRINFHRGFGFVLKQWKLITKCATEAEGLKLPLLTLLTKEYLARKLK